MPSNHGTTVYGINTLWQNLTCGTFEDISAVSTKLNMQSWQQLVPSLSGPSVTRHLVQAHCSLYACTHLNFTYDPVALRLVINALDPGRARPVDCLWIPPRAA